MRVSIDDTKSPRFSVRCSCAPSNFVWELRAPVISEKTNVVDMPRLIKAAAVAADDLKRWVKYSGVVSGDVETPYSLVFNVVGAHELQAVGNGSDVRFPISDSVRHVEVSVRLNDHWGDRIERELDVNWVRDRGEGTR